MDIYVFDNTLTKMKSVISEDECFEATEVREINKAGQLSLSLILAAKDEVNETDLLAIHKKDDEYYLYRVVKKNLMSDRVEILGLEYGYYSLKYDGYIKDIRPKKEALSDLIPRILNGTAWQIGKIDTKISPFTGNFYYIKRLDAIAEIANKLACEFEFIVTISNNQITSQRVNVLSHLGTHTGKRFEYGINALEVVAESDATSIVTQAIGRGKGEESGNGYGRRIDFSSVEWKKSNGDPVDKPKGKNWVNDPTTNYLLPGRKRTLEIVIFEEETDPEKLLKKTYKWLLQNNHPKVQFKAKVTEVENLTLGDYVNIIRPDLNIRYETRVFKLTRNLLNENFNEVEFGDNIASTPMDKLNSVSNSISGITDTIQRVEEEIDRVDATGVHIHYGKEEPVQKKKGDIWYKEALDGETILMRWNGETWEEVVSNKVIEEINTTVEQAMKDSNKAKEDATNAVQKADELTQQVADVSGQINQVEIKLDTNLKDIEGQMIEVKKTTGGLQTTVRNLDGRISTNTQTIEGFNQKVQSIEGQMTENTQTALGLQATVRNLDGRVTTNTQTIAGFNRRVQELDGKVSESTQTALGLQATVQQNKDKIGQLTLSSEHLQTDIRNLTNNTDSKFSQLSDRIDFKVSRGEVTNMIDVAVDGITIAGNKVHITGDTTIDRAVIKDSMIANLSANKLTAGTIDASKINVINLNANNIIGNRTEFVQTAWNGISSNVRINSNGIKAGNGGREVRLDLNGLNWKKSDGTGLAYFGNSWAIDKQTESLALTSEPGEYIGLAHRYAGESIATRYLSLEPDGRIAFESGGKVGLGGKDAYFTAIRVPSGSVWPTICGSSKKTGIAMGSQALYLYDENSAMTLNDIRIGKIQGLTAGDAKAKIGAMRVDNGGPWIAITGPDNDSKIVFGGDALYLGDSRGLYSLNTILKACKLR